MWWGTELSLISEIQGLDFNMVEGVGHLWLPLTTEIQWWKRLTLQSLPCYELDCTKGCNFVVFSVIISLFICRLL